MKFVKTAFMFLIFIFFVSFAWSMNEGVNNSSLIRIQHMGNLNLMDSIKQIYKPIERKSAFKPFRKTRKEDFHKILQKISDEFIPNMANWSSDEVKYVILEENFISLEKILTEKLEGKLLKLAAFNLRIRTHENFIKFLLAYHSQIVNNIHMASISILTTYNHSVEYFNEIEKTPIYLARNAYDAAFKDYLKSFSFNSKISLDGFNEVITFGCKVCSTNNYVTQSNESIWKLMNLYILNFVSRDDFLEKYLVDEYDKLVLINKICYPSSITRWDGAALNKPVLVDNNYIKLLRNIIKKYSCFL